MWDLDWIHLGTELLPGISQCEVFAAASEGIELRSDPSCGVLFLFLVSLLRCRLDLCFSVSFRIVLSPTVSLAGSTQETSNISNGSRWQ